MARTKDKLPKASQVFRESSFVFGQKESFYKVYPSVDKIRIEVEQSGRGVGGGRSTYGSANSVFDSYREYVDCSNPLCLNGGVQLGFAVSDMVRNKASDHKFSKSCQGVEPGPRRRAELNKPCMNDFSVKIHIDYKAEE
jgi:hypothetical protein